jgi:tetratricopeptide (TPR) repeat protein
MLPVPSLDSREDLVRWRRLWLEGAHGALLNEIGQAMKAGALPPEGYGLGALACIALERYDEAVKAAQNGIAGAARAAWLFGVLAEGYRGLAEGTSRREPVDGRHRPAPGLDGARAEAPGSVGLWAKAVAAADQAVRLTPDEPAWHALAARLRREAGYLAEALQTAERGLLRHPQSAHLLVERGLAGALSAVGYQAQGGHETHYDLHQALGELRQAQVIAPQDPWPLEAEGLLLTRAGRLPEAASAFRRALKRAPSGPPAESIEDQLAQAITARAPLSTLLRLLLLVTRVTVIGWSVILFDYYIFFRLLQIGWKLAPVFKPFGQGLLLVTAVGGALFLVIGHLTRLLIRRGAS